MYRHNLSKSAKSMILYEFGERLDFTDADNLTTLGFYQIKDSTDVLSFGLGRLKTTNKNHEDFWEVADRLDFDEDISIVLKQVNQDYLDVSEWKNKDITFILLSQCLASTGWKWDMHPDDVADNFFQDVGLEHSRMTFLACEKALVRLVGSIHKEIYGSDVEWVQGGLFHNSFLGCYPTEDGSRKTLEVGGRNITPNYKVPQFNLYHDGILNLR